MIVEASFVVEAEYREGIPDNSKYGSGFPRRHEVREKQKGLLRVSISSKTNKFGEFTGDYSIHMDPINGDGDGDTTTNEPTT